MQPREGSGKEREVRGKCILSKNIVLLSKGNQKKPRAVFPILYIYPRDGSLLWCLETDLLVTGNLNFVYNVLQGTWRRETALMKRTMSPFLDKNPRSDLYHDVKERTSKYAR